MSEESKEYYFGYDEVKRLELLMKAGLEADKILKLLKENGVDVSYYNDKIEAVFPIIKNILSEYIHFEDQDAFFKAIEPPPPPEIWEVPQEENLTA